MASEDPEVPQHGTAVKKEHVSLTVPQKVEIIRRLESGKSQSVVMASYSKGSYTTQRNRRLITIIYGIYCKSEGSFQVTDIENPEQV